MNVCPAPGLFEFFELVREKDDLHEYLRSGGLLHREMTCKCKKPMTLKVLSKTTDGYIWRCSDRECPKTKTIREGSIFKHKNILLRDLVMLFYMFCMDIQIFKAADFLQHVDRKSIQYFYGKLSKIASKEGSTIHINSDLRITNRESRTMENVITNDEGIIEIDESKFGRKRKANKGFNKVKRKWIVGLVQRGTRLTAFKLVNDRSSATLIPFIKEHVQAGSTIYTDEWKAYGNLKNDYKHSAVCHETEYVADDGTHTNTIEGK